MEKTLTLTVPARSQTDEEWIIALFGVLWDHYSVYSVAPNATEAATKLATDSSIQITASANPVTLRVPDPGIAHVELVLPIAKWIASAREALRRTPNYAKPW